MVTENPTAVKQDRNDLIYTLRKQGRSYTSIAREMGISAGRVTQIYEREYRKRDCFTSPLPDIPSCKEETALYRLIMNYSIEGFDENKMIAHRLYEAILKEWQSPYIGKSRNGYPPLDFIQTIEVEDDGWCRVRCIGKKTVLLLTSIQKYLSE